MFNLARVLSFIIIMIAVPVAAMADSVGPPEYWSGMINPPVQTGQDVRIDIHTEMVEASPDPEPLDILLWRVNKTANKKLMQNSLPIVSGHYTAHGWCQTSDANCLDHPENCDDCDGDGTNECPKFYCSSYDYSLTDACSPPGQTSYDLTRTDWECLWTRDFNVADNIHDCGVWSTVDPAGDLCIFPDDDQDDTIPDDDLDDGGDDGTDDSTDHGTDDSDNDGTDDVDDEGMDDGTDAGGDDDGAKAGCGGCSVEGDASGLPLTAAMLVIGLAAMIFSLRRKS